MQNIFSHRNFWIISCIELLVIEWFYGTLHSLKSWRNVEKKYQKLREGFPSGSKYLPCWLNIFILEIPQIQIQTQRLIHSKKFYFRLFSHCESIVQYSNIYHRSDCHIQPKPRVRFFFALSMWVPVRPSEQPF